MSKLRFALLFFVLLLIFAFGLFLGKVLPGGIPAPPPKIANTATILRQIQTLSELVTVKYVMERVVQLEDVKWYGENKVVLVAHGIAKAGIDLSKVRDTDIQISENKIRLKLPMPQITDVYLDEKETRILERSTGIMRSFDKELEQSARVQAVDDLGRLARSHGILKDAEERARQQLGNLFKQLGFAEVEIVEPYEKK